MLQMNRRRNGFTVLELLVSVAIIGMLVALLVPAVQRVRQRAARLECANNLRQLGIALNGFHDGKGGFPPAHWGVPSQSQVSVGWVPYILPYIDQEALFKEYHFDKRWDHDSNRAVSEKVIPLLLCPAAPPIVAKHGRARTDYAPTSAIDRPNPFMHHPLIKPDPTLVGVMGHDVFRKIVEITDGASNTLLLAEDAGQPEQWMMGHMAGSRVGPAGAWVFPFNRLKISGFNPVTMTTPGPCAVNCYNFNEIYSFHTGGANVLYADGSVHFLNEKLDINIGAALFTRKGGEVIPDGIYSD